MKVCLKLDRDIYCIKHFIDTFIGLFLKLVHDINNVTNCDQGL